MKLIDVSVPLDARLPSYPNNTPFSLEAIKRLARGDSSNVSTLPIRAHSGPPAAAPRPFFGGAAATEALSLDLLIGRTRVIEVKPERTISADDLPAARLSGAARGLIKARNADLWSSPDFHTDSLGVS